MAATTSGGRPASSRAWSVFSSSFSEMGWAMGGRLLPSIEQSAPWVPVRVSRRGGRFAEPARPGAGSATWLPGLHEEVSPAIEGPAGLVMRGADRLLLAVRDQGDPLRLDPLPDEISHGRLGAPLSQGQVVLARAALVAVALDQQQVVRAGLQPGGV